MSWSSVRGAPILQAFLYAKEQRSALGAPSHTLDPLGEEGPGPPAAAGEWSVAVASSGV